MAEYGWTFTKDSYLAGPQLKVASGWQAHGTQLPEMEMERRPTGSQLAWHQVCVSNGKTHDGGICRVVTNRLTGPVTVSAQAKVKAFSSAKYGIEVGIGLEVAGRMVWGERVTAWSGDYLRVHVGPVEAPAPDIKVYLWSKAKWAAQANLVAWEHVTLSAIPREEPEPEPKPEPEGPWAEVTLELKKLREILIPGKEILADIQARLDKWDVADKWVKTYNDSLEGT